MIVPKSALYLQPFGCGIENEDLGIVNSKF
jgi:hypothetical protein